MKYSSDILPISECCLPFLMFFVFSIVVYMSSGFYVSSGLWRCGGGGEFHQQLKPQGKEAPHIHWSFYQSPQSLKPQKAGPIHSLFSFVILTTFSSYL